MKVIASHQPHFVPWLRYIHKIASSDVFIYSDDVQYRKEHFQNRNKIYCPQSPDGWRWLTIPVKSSTPSTARIYEVSISQTDWSGRHLRLLENSYKGTPYFDLLMHHLETRFYRYKHYGLSDANKEMTEIMLDLLGVYKKPTVASWVDTSAAQGPTERLLALVQAHDGTRYITGEGARNYFDYDLFDSAGIEVEAQIWRPPAEIEGVPFYPDYSALDVLFRLGPKAGPALFGTSEIEVRKAWHPSL